MCTCITMVYIWICTRELLIYCVNRIDIVLRTSWVKLPFGLNNIAPSGVSWIRQDWFEEWIRSRFNAQVPCLRSLDINRLSCGEHIGSQESGILNDVSQVVEKPFFFFLGFFLKGSRHSEYKVHKTSSLPHVVKHVQGTLYFFKKSSRALSVAGRAPTLARLWCWGLSVALPSWSRRQNRFSANSFKA